MKTISKPEREYDFVIAGSGFGGSVAALRLTEKGYKVLVIEKGRHYRPEDFPRTNWNLRRWLWLPSLGFHGFFKMTFLRHIGILSGVGVGGGSLVYANTLPRPPGEFFAKELAEKMSAIIKGKPFVMTTEALFGIPTTAHILGGAVIGSSAENGVVDIIHKVFGYENIYICDGSTVPANPGVNPSLTITAMSERAMSKIPEKKRL
ncbi:MAG: NAD(P)-binding protein [Bacteroidales bacterium]|nr:NAD(P)-binding protein [Bacteroidales bacterium]